MKVLGLTGSIAMGKSTVAKMLMRRGISVHDSDATVHRLMAPGGAAFKKIAEVFPTVIQEGHIDRQALGKIVFGQPEKLKVLEGISHPLVARETRRFLARQQSKGADLVVLDIPLLFETGAENRCDFIACVSAPAFIQQQRALARSGMTLEKFLSIKARQTPDFEKRRNSDFVLSSGLGLAVTDRMVTSMLVSIGENSSRRPFAWPPTPLKNKAFKGSIYA
jgi:dephospho-CoA kinase